MGGDAQTAIDFGTSNEIDFKADNAARLTLTAATLYPVTNNQISLGTASLEFKDAFFDGTVTSDAFAGPLTGNASTATALATTRAINGVNFDGSAAITVTAAAGTVSGNTLNSGVVTSSLTTVGTIGSGIWQGTAIASGYIAADAITGAKIADDAINSEHYADGSIDNAHIADDAIDSEHYVNGSVDNAHLANSAVTITAGTGLTGGGSTALGASSTVNVIGGSGITANANDVAITADQTTVTSMYNAGLHVGRDADNTIYFSTDNEIRFQIANVLHEIAFLAGGVAHFDGDVYAFSTTTSSDRKLKTNIKPIENALDKVRTLEGVTFDWKDAERGASAGLIAQDVQAILPELVKETPNMGGNTGTHLNLNYDGVVGLLVAAVIELTEKVEAK
jgi:hypothetical protein